MKPHKIAWTEKTWNPIVGCSKVSPGCANCYAEKAACSPRLQQFEQYREVTKGVVFTATDKTKMTAWNGKTGFVESALVKPLHWRTPRMIFVCSMGDLFHESLPFEWIDKVFAVMALCPQHTFQVLTKRSKRMLEYLTSPGLIERLYKITSGQYSKEWVHPDKMGGPLLPLLNVWLGVTAEDQQRADERIPDLLKCPAAKRFVSCEPLLGKIDLMPYMFMTIMCPKCGHIDSVDNFDSLDCDAANLFCNKCNNEVETKDVEELDQVICGGESGNGARPMHPDWARDLRGQCEEAVVLFFFKQWGKYFPRNQWEYNPGLILPDDDVYASDGKTIILDDHCPMHPVGKKKAGRLLDGVEHNEMSETNEAKL